MSTRAVPVLLVVLFVALSGAGHAAEVTGTLLYDDQVVTDVFPDILAAQAVAQPTQGGAQITGTVDLASATYVVEGLDAVPYDIRVDLYRTYPTPWFGYPGDLASVESVEPTDPGQRVTLDVDVKYFYRVVSPIDSLFPLDGLRYDCAGHPRVPYPATFEIERVPRATDYRFEVTLGGCPSTILGYAYYDSADPVVVIPWGAVDEAFQILTATCTGVGGTQLCATPLFQYTDGDVHRLALTADDSAGRPIHRSDAVVLEAVASIPGSQGTYWSTAMSVANLADVDRTIDILYTPRDSNGLEDFELARVSIAARSQRSWTDVLGQLFVTTGAGALEIRGLDLAVTSRTSTPAAASGSYGQGIPPLQPEQVLDSHRTDTAVVGGLEENAAFRTNLGLCEIWGEGVTVRVTILDEAMTELGRREIDLRPYENTQINRVARGVADVTTLSGGLVRVTVLSGGGRVGAYLSVIDHATGDPTFVAIAPQTPAGG